MDIIIKPIVTEKMTHQGEALNRYGFVVKKDANKLQIKKAVEELYNVRVRDVRTMTRKGKPRRAKFRMTRTPDWKRAVVTLHEGSRIELF